KAKDWGLTLRGQTPSFDRGEDGTPPAAVRSASGAGHLDRPQHRPHRAGRRAPAHRSGAPAPRAAPAARRTTGGRRRPRRPPPPLALALRPSGLAVAGALPPRDPSGPARARARPP